MSSLWLTPYVDAQRESVPCPITSVFLILIVRLNSPQVCTKSSIDLWSVSSLSLMRAALLAKRASNGDVRGRFCSRFGMRRFGLRSFSVHYQSLYYLFLLESPQFVHQQTCWIHTIPFLSLLLLFENQQYGSIFEIFVNTGSKKCSFSFWYSQLYTTLFYRLAVFLLLLNYSLIVVTDIRILHSRTSTYISACTTIMRLLIHRKRQSI